MSKYFSAHFLQLCSIPDCLPVCHFSDWIKTKRLFLFGFLQTLPQHDSTFWFKKKKLPTYLSDPKNVYKFGYFTSATTWFLLLRLFEQLRQLNLEQPQTLILATCPLLLWIRIKLALNLNWTVKLTPSHDFTPPHILTSCFRESCKKESHPPFVKTYATLGYL